MGLTITLLGGPADGRTFPIPDERPPYMWRVPLVQPVALLADPSEYEGPSIADYQPTFKDGHFSRADDGSLIYGYRGMEELPHRGQCRPSPILEELAAMFRDPPATSYPSRADHLLACRTRHSLQRDERQNPEERAALDVVTWAHINGELRKRHMP